MSQSEVEGQLRIDMTRALGALARAAQHVGELIAAYVPEPVKAEQSVETGSIRFEHTDEDGDELTIRTQQPCDPDWHIVRAKGEIAEEGVAVRLRPDDLNRLAQYLDQYRTDVADYQGPCPPDTDMIDQPREHWCGRRVDHTAHTHSRDGEDMSCLGSHDGIYGS